MRKHPLAEVFGFPVTNMASHGVRCRQNRLCPFGNKVANCTKDKAKDPLGVCSIFAHDEIVITCPVRFRQHWIIAEDAASFLFPANTKWTTLTEVRLKQKCDTSAGNIDVVLVSYDGGGKVTDFGALEIQAVYISGNIRNPFEYYMRDPERRQQMDWRGRPNFPRPDYLSSSRKRLVPQLMFKGGILKAWNKKVAVALNKGFFDSLPVLQEVDRSCADIAWFVYDLAHDRSGDVYNLRQDRVVYTSFDESINKITLSEPGDIGEFIQQLQAKVDEKLDNENPPDTETIDGVF